MHKYVKWQGSQWLAPLREMPNVIVHSHIASASVPAVRRLREALVNVVNEA
jgi:lactate dehydrogenase-like 2-hydroxyacid dehydrogenase